MLVCHIGKTQLTGGYSREKLQYKYLMLEVKVQQLAFVVVWLRADGRAKARVGDGHVGTRTGCDTCQSAKERCVESWIASHVSRTMHSPTAFPLHPSPPIIQDVFSSPVSRNDRLCVKHFKAWGSRVTQVSR